MQRAEWQGLAMGVMAIWPRAKWTEDTLEAYFQVLQEEDFHDVRAGLQELGTTSPNAPSLAAVVGAARSHKGQRLKALRLTTPPGLEGMGEGVIAEIYAIGFGCTAVYATTPWRLSSSKDLPEDLIAAIDHIDGVQPLDWPPAPDTPATPRLPYAEG